MKFFELQKSFIVFLKRNITHALILVFGLSVGLFSTLVLSILLFNDLSFNRTIDNSENIYRIIKTDEHAFRDAMFPYAFSEILKKEIPDIKYVTRFLRLYGIIGSIHIKKNNEEILEKEFIASDPNIYKLLNIQVLHGSPEELDDDKHYISISKSKALKYFGSIDVVGSPLKLNYKGRTFTCVIKSVFDDLPWNSTIQPSMICNVDFLYEALNSETPTSKKEFFLSLNEDYFNIYFQLNENSTKENLKKKIDDISLRYFEDIEGRKLTIEIQNYQKIYLHSSDVKNDFTIKGKIETVNTYIFSILIILLITTVNYILLYTSLTTKRIKEIGIRKVFGATNKDLIIQFGIEAILMAIISLPIIWLLFTYATKILNSNFLSNIQVYTSNAFAYIFSLIAITLGIACISGLYISIIITRSSTINLLRNQAILKRSRLSYRSFFFAIEVFFSLLLINMSIILFNQIQYGIKTPYDFNTDQILNLTYNQTVNNNDYNILKSNLLNLPYIESVSGAIMAPPVDASSQSYFFLNDDPSSVVVCESYGVNSDFFKTLQLKIISGRTFDFHNIHDLENSIIVNYSLYRKFNFENPLNAKIKGRQVIGIVQNFNYHSFYEPLRPSIYLPNNFNTRALIIRTNSPITEQFKTEVYELCQSVLPSNKIMGINTFGDQLKMLYRKDIKFGNTVILFTILAIILTILGLFGIVLQSLHFRKREISIRRILGATKFNILITLIKQNLIITLVCGIAASIVAYILGEQWLQNFIYTRSINIWYFPMVIIMVWLLIIIISFITSHRFLSLNPRETIQIN